MKEDYIEILENALMKALDKLSENYVDFDYYDMLVELTGFSNSVALGFLDKYGDSE